MQSFILAAAALSAVANGFVLPRQANSAEVCGSTSSVNHKIIEGDTLTTIAKQYSSGICDIAFVNNIEDVNVIPLGETIVIPENCTDPDNDSCGVTPTPEATETCVPGVGSTYDVREGDGLWAIGQSFNITLDAVVAANPQIEDIDLIFPGQIINIPVCPESLCEGVGTRAIQEGDTFFNLAQTFATTVGQILALNYGVDPTKLAIGQQVIFPVQCHNGTLA